MANHTEISITTEAYWPNSTDVATIDNSSSVLPVLYAALGVYCVAFVMNVFGNTLILVSVSRVPWLRKKMYAAIQALALADLQVSIYILITVSTEFFVEVSDMVSACLGVLKGYIMYVAVYHVILVAVDRFIAIQFPLYYQTKVTIRHIRILSGVFWILAGVNCIGEFFNNFAMILNLNFRPKVVTVLQTSPYIILYFVIATAMCFLHGKVTITARRRIHDKKAKTTPGTGEAKIGIDRATKMMIIVVGVYVILWTPFCISHLIHLVNNGTMLWSDILALFGIVLGTFNSSVNFIIYYALNSKLRAAFRQTLKLPPQMERAAKCPTVSGTFESNTMQGTTQRI